jgi:hypothetical protein
MRWNFILRQGEDTGAVLEAVGHCIFCIGLEADFAGAPKETLEGLTLAPGLCAGLSITTRWVTRVA